MFHDSFSPSNPSSVTWTRWGTSGCRHGRARPCLRTCRHGLRLGSVFRKTVCDLSKPGWGQWGFLGDACALRLVVLAHLHAAMLPGFACSLRSAACLKSSAKRQAVMQPRCLIPAVEAAPATQCTIHRMTRGSAAMGCAGGRAVAGSNQAEVAPLTECELAVEYGVQRGVAPVARQQPRQRPRDRRPHLDLRPEGCAAPTHSLGGRAHDSLLRPFLLVQGCDDLTCASASATSAGAYITPVAATGSESPEPCMMACSTCVQGRGKCMRTTKRQVRC